LCDKFRFSSTIFIAMKKANLNQTPAATCFGHPRIMSRFFPHGPTAANGPGPPHYRGFTNTLSHHTQEGSSRQVIGKSQRPLPDKT
jgi:hypothetical protein